MQLKTKIEAIMAMMLDFECIDSYGINPDVLKFRKDNIDIEVSITTNYDNL